jgi:hypothetical protein
MNDKERHAIGVKSSVDNIIGASTFLKQKRKQNTIQKEKFNNIIRLLEEIDVRGTILENDIQIDLSKYDDKFYRIIDTLLEIHFGKEICELIFFYVYDRITTDGSIRELIDPYSGQSIILSSPDDLWELIQIIQEKSGKSKK